MRFFKESPLKNGLLAVALMTFLAISFKLCGDLTDESQTKVSQTDSVFNSLNEKVVPPTEK